MIVTTSAVAAFPPSLTCAALPNHTTVAGSAPVASARGNDTELPSMAIRNDTGSSTAGSPTVRSFANCTPSPPPRSRLAATVTAAPDRSVGARKKVWARCTVVLFGAVTSLPENSKSEQPPSSTDAAVPRATTPVRSCPVATMLQRRTLKDARMSSTKRPKTVTAAASAGPSVRGFHKAAIIDCSLRLSISGPAVLNAVWCTVTDEGLADRSSPPSTRIALSQSC